MVIRNQEEQVSLKLHVNTHFAILGFNCSPNNKYINIRKITNNLRMLKWPRE